jgi:pimeloyl-ACP methyl ester carboxylesterase
MMLAVALVSLVRAEGPISGISERSLDEPVFHGKTVAYTSGPLDAPAVVLVHGLGDKAAHDWDGLIPLLAKDFRVLAFDLPGFGRASHDNAPYTPTNYAAFVRFIVEKQFGTRPILLVGHSLGGAIALRYAAQNPRRVTALVLVDVPGILYRSAYSQYLTRLGLNSLPNLYPAQRDHLRGIVSDVFGFMEKLRPTPEAIVFNPLLRKNFLSADPTKIAGLALALEDFGADLARATMPTLLLWGGRDEIAPLRNGWALSAMLPNAQLEIFESSGHTPMDDVPAAFGERVAGFLRQPVLTHVNGILRGAMPDVASTRSATCREQRDVAFEGEYDQLLISRCRGVTVRNARVRYLRIVDSTASIENSRIGGAEVGLSVDDARVSITGSRIEGKVAITAVGADLDLAGVRIVGEEASVRAPSESQLLFSISRAQSANFTGRIHGLLSVRPDRPL